MPTLSMHCFLNGNRASFICSKDILFCRNTNDLIIKTRGVKYLSVCVRVRVRARARARVCVCESI